MDSRQEMADTTHFDTIAGALQNELRDGFSFHQIHQVNKRNLLAHLLQAVQHLRSLPVRTRVLGQNQVKGLRTYPFGELLGSYNDIGTDRESRTLELTQATFDINRGPMDEEDAQEMLSALRSF